MIEAKIILDSLAPSGRRLTTFQLRYPRFIHAEFMTHRVFSRNASSSRAIPVNKMIDQIESDWAKPIVFHKNTKGMQGKVPLTVNESSLALHIWEEAKNDAIKHARRLVQLGVHKQQANRILEPFMHTSVVCTATEYDNFFALRHHHMAQPEIEILAMSMYDAYKNSEPVKLEAGQWHLPYVGTGYDYKNTNYSMYTLDEMIKMSVARCARVSYLRHDGTNPSFEDDAKLYDRLLGAQPIHASPAEHQAMASVVDNIPSGNLFGWTQYRKTLRGENVKKFLPGMFDDGDR